MSKEYKFKVKKEMSPSMIFAFVAAAVGFLSLIFLSGSGAVLHYTNTAKANSSIMLWSLTWGGGAYDVAISAGLVVAFFLTILASLLSLGIGGFRYIGFLTMLIFLASGVLDFCTVPLVQQACEHIGRGYITIGWGAIVSGVMNIIGAVASFLGARAD